MKKTIQRLKNERGLTLVELLAVIVILAIIAVIAFVMIGNVMENSKKDAHISNAQQLIAAAKLYDATEKTITSIDNEKLHNEGYLDKLINPWTKSSATEDYKGTVTKNGVTFTVTITGKDINCNIKDQTEENLAKGRKTICP